MGPGFYPHIYTLHLSAATSATSGHLPPASHPLHVVTELALVLWYHCNLQETSRTSLGNSPCGCPPLADCGFSGIVVPTPQVLGHPKGLDVGGQRVLALKTSLAPSLIPAGAPAMFSCCTRTRSKCCLLFLPEAELLLYFLELLIVNFRVLREKPNIYSSCK